MSNFQRIFTTFQISHQHIILMPKYVAIINGMQCENKKKKSSVGNTSKKCRWWFEGYDCIFVRLALYCKNYYFLFCYAFRDYLTDMIKI